MFYIYNIKVFLSIYCFCFESGQALLEQHISTNLIPRLENTKWQFKQKNRLLKLIQTKVLQDVICVNYTFKLE